MLNAGFQWQLLKSCIYWRNWFYATFLTTFFSVSCTQEFVEKKRQAFWGVIFLKFFFLGWQFLKVGSLFFKLAKANDSFWQSATQHTHTGRNFQPICVHIRSEGHFLWPFCTTADGQFTWPIPMRTVVVFFFFCGLHEKIENQTSIIDRQATDFTCKPRSAHWRHGLF